MVVSDHSPCTADLKLLDAGDFLQAWGGIASLQFGRSITRLIIVVCPKNSNVIITYNTVTPVVLGEGSGFLREFI